MKVCKRILLLLSITLLLLSGACTALPAPPPEVPTPEGRPVDLEGIRFTLHPAVAELAFGQAVLEKPGTPDGPYWDVYPQHAVVTLDGYAVEGSVQKPMIAMYPAAEYARMSPEAEEILNRLAGILEAGEAAEGPLPALPVINYGQGLHSNVKFLDFQNGSGLRFLTMYTQGANPITNQELMYVFQGLTHDGQKAVAVFLPVNHPELPADYRAVTDGQMNQIMADFGAYQAEVTGLLESQPPGSFTPSLETLDALVASLQVD